MIMSSNSLVLTLLNSLSLGFVLVVCLEHLHIGFDVFPCWGVL